MYQVIYYMYNTEKTMSMSEMEGERAWPVEADN